MLYIYFNVNIKFNVNLMLYIISYKYFLNIR